MSNPHSLINDFFFHICIYCFLQILSFFLMFVIFAVRGNEGRMSSLLICFTYIGVRLVSYPITGGYLNPGKRATMVLT